MISPSPETRASASRICACSSVSTGGLIRSSMEVCTREQLPAKRESIIAAPMVSSLDASRQAL